MGGLTDDDYWDKIDRDRKHREILDGQDRIAEATETAGWEAANASQELADQIRVDREFQIFWDTLSRKEKIEWRASYAEELRVEAERLTEIAAQEEKSESHWNKSENYS